MKRRLAVLAVVVLGACAAQEQESWRTFVPIAANEWTIKRGVGLYAGDCELLEALNVGWYYSGEKHCEGVEYVEYITHIWALYDREPTPYTLLWNEPEYRPSSIAEMVAAFVPFAEAHPDVTWVGPCPGWNNMEVFSQFWAEFEWQAGHPMPPERVRVCFHCYAGADFCMAQVARAANIAEAMGVPRGVWLTELGRPLGLDRTIRQNVAEMARLVDLLEASPDVERYAWWPGLLKAGSDVPDGRLSGWQPLATEYHDWNLSPIGYQLTEYGEMYAGR